MVLRDHPRWDGSATDAPALGASYDLNLWIGHPLEDANVCLEEDRLCCLVMVGMRVDETKELVAIADGYPLDVLPGRVILEGVKDGIG